jgi:hypothetical protein
VSGRKLPLAFNVAPAFLALAIVGPIAKWIDLRGIASKGVSRESGGSGRSGR